VVAHGPPTCSARPLVPDLCSRSADAEKLERGPEGAVEKGGRLGEVLVGMKVVSEET